MNPAAIFIRSDLPDCAYVAHEPSKIIRGSSSDWPLLAQELAAWQKPPSANAAADATAPPHPAHPPGLAAGYFAYDGSFEFQFHPTYQITSLDALSELNPSKSAIPSLDATEKAAISWHQHMSPEAYQTIVRRAQEYIRAGDIYQVNLALKRSLKAPSFDPLRFFRILWQRARAPQSAFLSLTDRALISASPELFLDIRPFAEFADTEAISRQERGTSPERISIRDGRSANSNNENAQQMQLCKRSIQDRTIRTQPIKGTRPRRTDPKEDQKEADELEASVKERAELVMITDLERNDLGKICDYGTVRVPELLKRVSFSHVHHLISTVEGRLRPNVTPLDAVRACFPGGSITGAPKKRAMEIIAELESEPRGFYTGAIGYFGFDGSARFNIAIRTCEYQYATSTLAFFVGSGITILSSPEMEYEETCHKARALEEAYALYQSIGS